MLAHLTTQADAIDEIVWTVSVDSTVNCAHQHATNTARPHLEARPVTCWSESDTDMSTVEPAGHGIGRSRGGLTTKVHHAVDGHGCPLAIIISPGQSTTARPCRSFSTTSECLAPTAADRAQDEPGAKAYSSKQTRAVLSARGISAAIPERADQQTNRKRKGRNGGRPVHWTQRPTKAETSSSALSTYQALIHHFGGVS